MAVTGEKIDVAAGSQGEYKVDLYIGPKDQATLKELVSAWVLPADQKNRYSLRKLSGQDVYLMAVTGEKIDVAAGKSG
jgi:hypothetical protein